MFTNKSILVTGGTGSFGKCFIRRLLANYKPRRLVIFSRDELKQFDMQQEFPEKEYPQLRYFIGDVRDAERLKMAMRDIDYVVHAAALKQVPAAEYNPFECIKTNIMGAENVIHAAIYNRVKKVIALSTDKAANPINLYGATKLASDRAFIASNNLSGTTETRFSVVRYGNVVGSRGSVIPFFANILAKGNRKLPITDPRMTRFWITLDEGVQFVIDNFERMAGGEIFIPKIPSMKVVDLAKVMAPECELETIGIRPGEKLHEVMIPQEESRNTLEFEKYYVIQPQFKWWNSENARQGGGTPVHEDFSYASDNNPFWMTPSQIQTMLDGI